MEAARNTLLWLGADGILLASFAVAIAFFLAQWRKIPEGHGLASILRGRGKLDPRNSWITNLTLLGTFLATALKENLVRTDAIRSPTPTWPPSPTGAVVWLGDLSLFFAAVVIVATLIYLASMRRVGDDKDDKYESCIGAYLVSGLLAVWAAVGQVLTLDCLVLLAELKKNGLSAFTTGWFALLVTAGGIAAGIYGWQTMRQQIAVQIRPWPDAPPPRPAPEAVLIEPQPAPAREWSLL